MTAQKYCDLVMKGGITSGIVYPNAVLALAKEYRFKNIGGTSAGAIAAAVCAAAAMGDRARAAGTAPPDENLGFDGLATVARQLSTRGFIYSLFQPAAGARNAYRVLVVLAGPGAWWRKLVAVALAVLAIAPVETLLTLVLLCGLGYWFGGASGILAALLPSLACAWGFGATFAVLRVARVARGNLMGLCSGMRTRGTVPALSEWLHEVLQALSGKAGDGPLTFADLYAAPRYAGEPGSQRAINLQVITTGVSHREPRTLPFENSRFWFLREEFERLFPPAVVDWMVTRGGAPIECEGRTYHPLPADDQLPVLVATRMSLSFPLLISAVPLHEPARRTVVAPAPSAEAAAQGAAPREKTVAASTDSLASGGERPASGIAQMRVCWFSDGGISSNFPIHLFDTALPAWPTFAINLVYPETDDTRVPASMQRTREQRIEEAVFLPSENNQGWKRTYQSVEHTSAAREVAGFVFGILATMQNWRDLLQARAPGQRDRIVHVSLDGDEGGMNLDMPDDVLKDISDKGTAAGERFREFSFENHYWIRWRNLASALQRYTVAVGESEKPANRVPAYAAAYALPTDEASVPPSYRFGSQDQRRAAQRLYRDLADQGLEWDDLGPDLTDGAPRPLPQMKITPTY